MNLCVNCCCCCSADDDEKGKIKMCNEQNKNTEADGMRKMHIFENKG